MWGQERSDGGAQHLVRAALLAGAGLLTLAALAAHAYVNARAAADFLSLGVPPFQYRWDAGLLRVTGVPSAAAQTPGRQVIPGDQIARIAGMPVEASPHWRHHLLWRVNGRPLRRGQSLALTVVRYGQARDVVVTLEGISPAQVQEIGHIRAMTLPAQVAGFCLWLLGVLVLLRRRDGLAALFFLWNMALALYTARSATAALLWDCYPPALIRLFQYGFMIGWFLSPALFGHFCRVFAGPNPLRKADRGLRIGISSVGQSAIGTSLLPLLFYVVPLCALVVLLVPALHVAAGGSGTRLLWFAVAGSWLGTLALGVAMLVRARLRAEEPLRRRQVEFVLAGSLAYALVVLHAFVTVLAGWDADPTTAWAWIPHVLLLGTPLAFAFAILRHRLLDLDLVIRRSLVYALLTLSMAAVFVALQHLASTMLEMKTGASSLPAQTLAALVVAALFAPTERRIKQGVEALFNRRQIQRLDDLRRLGREISFSEEGEELERSLVPRLAEVLEIEFAALFWLDREHEAYRLLAETGLGEVERGALSFPRDGALAVRLEAEGEPLHCAALPPDLTNSRLGAEVYPRLSALGAALAVPLAVRGQLHGLLLLGARQDHDLYSPEEQEALLALGSLAAAALEHAALARRVRDLERRVQDPVQLLLDGGATPR